MIEYKEIVMAFRDAAQNVAKNHSRVAGLCTALADVIEELVAENERLRRVEQQNDGWNNVKDGLPPQSELWEKYNVVVLRPCYSSPFPESYDIHIVTTAAYDSNQKIWHLDWDEQLNACINIGDAPLNCDFVTHWMPLPEAPKED